VLARWRSPEVLHVALLVGIVVAGEWDVIAGPNVLSMDTATAFYPWFAFLGEQLRSGAAPAWNPNQFAGTPFAADPESGWMYLPAMLMFSLFPLSSAAKGFILLQALLAALSTYALARTLGASAVAATFAGATYALSGFLFSHACSIKYSMCAYSTHCADRRAAVRFDLGKPGRELHAAGKPEPGVDPREMVVDRTR
jgi:hypothetical protein